MPMLINLYKKFECIPSKICIFYSIILFLTLIISCTEAKAKSPLELPIRHSIRNEQDECKAVKNKPLQAVMDRVCELCHDMYSHQVVNMRALCRANCFRSDQFKKCLSFFKPARSSRQTLSAWNSPINNFLIE